MKAGPLRLDDEAASNSSRLVDNTILAFLIVAICAVVQWGATGSAVSWMDFGGKQARSNEPIRLVAPSERLANQLANQEADRLANTRWPGDGKPWARRGAVRSNSVARPSSATLRPITLVPGQSYTVLGMAGDEVRVRLSNGQVGRVPRSALSEAGVVGDALPSTFVATPVSEASTAAVADRANGVSANNADYLDLGVAHAVAEIATDGSSITLADGSQWEVAVADHATVAEWVPAQHVVVSRPTANSRTYRLTNQDLGQTVSATFLAE